jgi:hypothetical protein
MASRRAPSKETGHVPFGWYWELIITASGKVVEHGFIKKATQPVFEVDAPPGREYVWTPLFQ